MTSDDWETAVQGYYEYKPFLENGLNMKAKQGIVDFMVKNPIDVTKVAIYMENIKISLQGDSKKAVYIMARQGARSENWVEVMPVEKDIDNIIFNLENSLLERNFAVGTIVTFEKKMTLMTMYYN